MDYLENCSVCKKQGQKVLSEYKTYIDSIERCIRYVLKYDINKPEGDNALRLYFLFIDLYLLKPIKGFHHKLNQRKYNKKIYGSCCHVRTLNIRISDMTKRSIYLKGLENRYLR